MHPVWYFGSIAGIARVSLGPKNTLNKPCQAVASMAA